MSCISENFGMILNHRERSETQKPLKMKAVSPATRQRKCRRGKRSGQKRKVRAMVAEMENDLMRSEREEIGVSEVFDTHDKENMCVWSCANAPSNFTQFIIDEHEKRREELALALRTSSNGETWHCGDTPSFGPSDESFDSTGCHDFNASPSDFYSDLDCSGNTDSSAKSCGIRIAEEDDLWLCSLAMGFGLLPTCSGSEEEFQAELERDMNEVHNVYDSDSSLDQMFDFMSDEFKRLYDDTLASSLQHMSREELVTHVIELQDRVSSLERQLEGKDC